MIVLVVMEPDVWNYIRVGLLMKVIKSLNCIIQPQETLPQ